MPLKKIHRLLILLNVSLIFMAVSFFALASEKNTFQEGSGFLAFLFASYELILAGFENGNLKPEADNFFLTLYKWIAFLTDLFNAK